MFADTSKFSTCHRSREVEVTVVIAEEPVVQNIILVPIPRQAIDDLINSGQNHFVIKAGNRFQGTLELIQGSAGHLSAGVFKMARLAKLTMVE